MFRIASMIPLGAGSRAGGFSRCKMQDAAHRAAIQSPTITRNSLRLMHLG
jgi:hypothetical protein